MGGLEFSLQIFVHLIGVAHIVVHEILVRDLKGHEELGSVCLPLKVRKSREQPEEDVLERFLLTVDHVAAEVRIEVAGVAQHLQEPADALFGLFLRLLLHVDALVDFIEVGKHFVDQFNQFHGSLVIELDHAQIRHEWGSVQHVYYQFDLLRVKVRCFGKHFVLTSTSVAVLS